MKEISNNNQGEIILYQTPDNQTALEVRFEKETIWLTQKQMAELFGTKRPAITKHLINIYKSGELIEKQHMFHFGTHGYKWSSKISNTVL